jgi:peptidylprolyl isomerase
MGTTKRERQKAARALRVEAMKKQQKASQTKRSVVISLVVVALLAGSAVLVFSKGSPSVATIPTTIAPTTTMASTTSNTSTIHVIGGFASIPKPSPAGVFGKAPKVVVPTTPPPKVEQASDLIIGKGATMKLGQTFTAQYVLATYSTHGVVQSSWTSQPFSTTLSYNGLIPGWVKGMIGMKVGGRRELIIPPSLGYGASSPGTGIAANDTLVFVIDLLKIG